jgi:hypothetical protein
MRATLMYVAGDVRIENVPDAQLIEPTDVLIRVTLDEHDGSSARPQGRAS